MKTTIKRENGEFLVLSLKHVLGLTDRADRLGTPKLWAIAHEKGQKRENAEFLCISLKHVSGFMGRANRCGTPKLWAINHENGHNTRKRRFFCHNSQTCFG